MVKDQLVRVWIVIRDVRQLYLPRDRELCLRHDRVGNVRVRLVRLLDKIVAHIEEKRLIECHARQLVVDAARRGQKPHRRDTKRREQGNHA